MGLHGFRARGNCRIDGVRRLVLPVVKALPLLLALVAFVPSGLRAVSVDDFVARWFTNAQGVLPYRLFIPPNYNPAQRYPLVLFLHGAGEAGDDNWYQLVGQTGELVFASETNQAVHPSFMVAPQAPVSYPWTDASLRLRVSGMLDALTNEFAVDKDRLYITGLSLGGFGSWDYILQNPDRYAAAIPMSGGASLNASLAAKINRIAIWNFHAADDGTVDVLNSQSAIATLRRAGGNPVYTEYAFGGHVIWTEAYGTPGLMDWVYSQRRGVPSSTEPVVRFAKPTPDAVWKTGATNLAVSGTARALGQTISTMTLVNYANNARGVTFAGNAWDAGAVPIKANTTNILSVLARTTSWYPPFGGSTTFTASLFVIQSPLSARYLRQGGGLALDWSGGGPPYRVQFAPALGDAWTDYIQNATPPLALPSSPGSGFYRVVGQ